MNYRFTFQRSTGYPISGYVVAFIIFGYLCVIQMAANRSYVVQYPIMRAICDQSRERFEDKGTCGLSPPIDGRGRIDRSQEQFHVVRRALWHVESIAGLLVGHANAPKCQPCCPPTSSHSSGIPEFLIRYPADQMARRYTTAMARVKLCPGAQSIREHCRKIYALD